MTASTSITIPDLALVVLIGPSGAGKSSFAARHFAPSEVLSSDFCRFLVAGDENDQSATPAAFDVLGYIAGKRLEAGRLTVVDATSVQREARAPLIALAREHHVLPVAIVLDVPEKVCAERNATRPDRDIPAHAMHRQHQQLRKSIKGLQREGFRRVFVLKGADEIDAVTIERERRWTDRRDDRGPFDFIGDVHGCADELVLLLTELGYDVAADRSTAVHPAGRRAFFVGDLVDRGPDSPGVLRLVMGMVRDGTAACIPGNHENKLARALAGRNVQVSHGLAETLAQLEAEPAEFRAEVAAFIDGLVSHAVLDDGRCVVAHAGLPERLHNRSSGAVRAFALYGDTTGETDEFGLPVRYPWADDYRGSAIVVYGHTPVPEAEWINNTICIDTGCVFGGELTALRYPERELVSVPAARTYWEPIKPLRSEVEETERPAALLDATDVLGKRIVDTRLQPRITIGADNAAAAFEVMSRFAIDPRWLVYLPPTMAPTATSARADLLEHPTEAFAAYRRDGITEVICEEKHMGSRAVVVVCRDAEVAARRFGIDDPIGGTIHTRTGRAFFADPAWQAAVVERTRAAIGAADLWDTLETDWLALDTELPVERQGPRPPPQPVRSRRCLRPGHDRARRRAAGRCAAPGHRRFRHRPPDRGSGDLHRPVRRRVPPVLLVGRGARRTPSRPLRRPRCRRGAARGARSRLAHGHGRAARRRRNGFIRPNRNLTVDLDDPDSEAAAVTWWDQLVGNGGEGMVVKPLESIATGTRGLIQPGIKC